MAQHLLLKIDVFSIEPLYQQVANELASLILSGGLSPGERLPSIRALARQVRLSVDTIKQAFRALSTRGLVLARPGSGYYVASNLELPGELSASDDHGFIDASPTFPRPHQSEPQMSWSIEAVTLSMAFKDLSVSQDLNSNIEFDFRVREPDMRFQEGPGWNRAVKRWCRDYLVEPDSSAHAAGLPQLRQEVAAWLKRTRGIDCLAQDLVITSGLEQARDLAARVLVDSGDEVVIEDPCSTPDLLAYVSRGARLIHVPHDQQGIDTARLSTIPSAQVVHLVPGSNYPAGVSMSLERRQEVLDWAAENDVLIVEDGFGAGYSYQPSQIPTLYSLAKQRAEKASVIYLGSLSEHLQPGLNIGFMLVPTGLRSALRNTSWLAERHPSVLTQGLILTLIQEGFFEKHALRLIGSIRRKREAILSAISRWPTGVVSFSPVEAGLQQPVWFDQLVDDKLVCLRAAAHGIVVTPVSPHFSSGPSKSGLCIGMGRIGEERIADGLQKLLEVILDCIASSAPAGDSAHWVSGGESQAGAVVEY